jgi:hypothetical protein
LSGEHKRNLFLNWLFEPRVPQPPAASSSAENPEGAAWWVAFSLVTFFLAKQKKVTSCRATPDSHTSLCGKPQPFATRFVEPQSFRSCEGSLMGTGCLPQRHVFGGAISPPIKHSAIEITTTTAKLSYDQVTYPPTTKSNIPAIEIHSPIASRRSMRRQCSRKLNQSPPHAPSDPHDTKTSPSDHSPHA